MPIGTRGAPTTTLFPYTTLFRSDVSARPRAVRPRTRGPRDQHPDAARGPSALDRPAAIAPPRKPRYDRHGRSEEHTSELQSQFHLVCRLLLDNNNLYLQCALREL